MKTFLAYIGISEIKSPRMAIPEAFTYGLIEDGEQWIDMMIDQNKTSHLYDEQEAKLIYGKIKDDYSRILSNLYDKSEEITKLA